MKKVTPITGRHTTFSSLVAEAMIDERAVGGLVIYFEEDGTMHFGDVGLKRGDVGMALMFVHMLSDDVMRSVEP